MINVDDIIVLGFIKDAEKRIFCLPEHPSIKLHEVINADKSGTGEYLIVIHDNGLNTINDGYWSILRVSTENELRVFHAALTYKNCS